MSRVFFIGCLHLGHENIAIKHRGWNNSEDHDNNLISSWNKVVNKKDLVYILGDVTMETSEHYYKLGKLNGRKKVILGNHDKGKDIPELLRYVETVAGMERYKECWLTHCPVHPQELTYRVKYNIHAHIHSQKLNETLLLNSQNWTTNLKSRYFNVDAHEIGYTPILFDDILKIIEKNVQRDTRE